MNHLPDNFHQNVFINCPYDKEYTLLLRVMLYTLRRCGLFPRIALERFDSGEVRLQKISELILESGLSIHDMSRTRVRKKGGFARMNMPLELGMDLGCRAFHGAEHYRQKRMLILESERFSIQKALSDMSFADCKTHHGSEEELCFVLRDWVVELGHHDLPPGSVIWQGYNSFWAEITSIMTERGYKERDIGRLTIVEYMRWIEWELNGET